MKFILKILSIVIVISSCTTIKSIDENISQKVFAVGSCSKQDKNQLWDKVLQNKPSVWIWGGDVIYPKTYSLEGIRDAYDVQKNNPSYQALLSKTEVIGSWDDHDYGLNDGGYRNVFKSSSQELFLDFMNVSDSSPRRRREGVYTSHNYGNVKVIVLDTRYFRSDLNKTTETGKRYRPNPYGEGTMLGEKQWTWLKNELSKSHAKFNVIVSSIQFLSSEHGYETWANMPHERDKMFNIIKKSKAKNVMFLSGDRHFSELSKIYVPEIDYPIYDFTVSGLTHTYTKSTESNLFRVSPMIKKINFGLLKFHKDKVTFEIKDKYNKVLYSKSNIYR